MRIVSADETLARLPKENGFLNELVDLISTLLVSAATIVAAIVASVHAILGKRDVRSAIGWVGLIWLVPIVGAVLYYLFGINRIRRRASELRAHRSRAAPPQDLCEAPGAFDEREQRLAPVVPPEGRHLLGIAALVDAINPYPLTTGNTIEPLDGGEIAFSQMLEAIRSARRTVAMASYIFDNDRAGAMFASALAKAVHRGVQVRVVIDGVGAHYSYPTGTSRLRRLGVPVAAFLPTFVPFHLPYGNLRNHRKLLIVDGRIGFTGGMNVRGGYLLVLPRREPSLRDVHFRLEGPVVAHLAQTFAEDWAFCTREQLGGEDWFPPLSACGHTAARGIAAGPDEDVERLRWTILTAVARAQSRIRIVSPYFVPDHMLITSLELAAMRGVQIEILLPERGNLRLVQWASWAQLRRLIDAECRVWLTPPPFDHAKMMTVDGLWTMIGSANWDERSLRLNFELNVECYDAALAATMDRLIDARRSVAREVTRDEVASQSRVRRLRDRTAWLLSPYL